MALGLGSTSTCPVALNPIRPFSDLSRALPQLATELQESWRGVSIFSKLKGMKTAKDQGETQ
jgi:hypothetical protein